MENVRELMHQRKALISQASALVDVAEKENRNLTDAEQSQYGDLIAQADGLNKRIERQRELAALAGGHDDAARPDPLLGMSAGDVQRYSFVRAIRAAANNDWRGAELERDASLATAKALGMNPRSFFVPPDVMVNRGLRRALTPYGWQYGPIDLRADMAKTPATAGGNLISTDLLSASFIELLRNRMILQRAGATMLGDLVGDVAIPKQTGGATAYWIGAKTNITAESSATIGQVTLSPKTVGAYTDIDRKLIKQSSIDVENFVRGDLATVAALAIDQAGLHGTGLNNQPTGVAATNGIGMVYAGGAADNLANANGAAPVWADVVNLESEVAADNADIGTLAYITNTRMRGKLKQAVKVAGTSADFLWDREPNPLNGYMAHVTNQVKSNLSKGTANDLSAMFFGNWADLIIGMWGALDVYVDTTTLSLQGGVRVIVLQDVDIAVRHAESFAAGIDFVTS